MEKRKVYSSFTDNVWGADLTDMQWISRFYKGICFLLCVIDIFNNYEWVIPLKDKKGITITKAIQNILDESNSKPKTILVDKNSKFHKKSI